MHPTSVPQIMRNQPSPAFSFITCHSSRWDNWPDCKTVIGTPVSGSWNVVFTDEEDEFQRWFFCPPAGIPGRKRLFYWVLVVSRPSKDSLLLASPLQRWPVTAERLCHSAAVAPKETLNPWDVGDPGSTSFKWHFMWQMPFMLLYYTCSDPVVSECCINYYWNPPNGIILVINTNSECTNPGVTCVKWFCDFHTRSMTKSVLERKEFSKMSPQPQFNLKLLEVRHILPWQHWACHQELLYYLWPGIYTSPTIRS